MYQIGILSLAFGMRDEIIMMNSLLDYGTINQSQEQEISYRSNSQLHRSNRISNTVLDDRNIYSQDSLLHYPIRSP